MRILVYPHDLGLGGSQLNAVEIAGRMAGQGHDVVVFGQQGPLEARIAELGLDFVRAPRPRRRPSPAVLRALTDVVRERRIDVVHGYEWPPILEAWLVATRVHGVTAVGTIMSMSVAPFLPRHVPLVVGTAQIAAVEKAQGRPSVSIIEPPVDLVHNDPALSVGEKEFRSRWGGGPGVLTAVTVTRLAHEMKLEGLLTAIDVIADLRSGQLVRLVVVGGGPAADQVREHVERANARAGREAVVLTGELTDPRPAYASADVFLGMGSSALRAMAYRKPLVVQGERGFWRLLTPESVDDFLWTGWYGMGPGSQSGAQQLTAALVPVLADEELRADLGSFGREIVEEFFALEKAADRQLQVYEQAEIQAPRLRTRSADAARTARQYVAYAGRRKLSRLRGRANTDDFNAVPVIAHGPARSPHAARAR